MDVECVKASFGTPLSLLPQVVVEQILGYLNWNDKIQVCNIFPAWMPYLSTGMAWKWFHTDYESVVTRCQLREMHESVSRIVSIYGKYMQNVSIVLHYFDLTDMGFGLLDLIHKHCSNLRSFQLFHPTCFTFSQDSEFYRYVSLLNNLVTGQYLNNRPLKLLKLYNLDYLPIRRSSGISELFDAYCEHNITKAVSELEFSHAYDFGMVIPSLTNFDQLKILKCQIQSVNTDIIACLCLKNLRELFLVSDGSTLNEGYNEHFEIHWVDIARRIGDSKKTGYLSVRERLKVHYIFQGRMLKPIDLHTSNMFVHSVILDSLCYGVTEALMETIASNYGKSLQLYGHLTTEWNYMAYEHVYQTPSMYADFVNQCDHLKTVILGAELPCHAVVSIAQERKLNIIVDKDSLLLESSNEEAEEELQEMEGTVSNLLGCQWQALPALDFIKTVRGLTKALHAMEIKY